MDKSVKGIVFVQDSLTKDLKYINQKGEQVIISNPSISLQNREMIEHIYKTAKHYTFRYYDSRLKNELLKGNNHFKWLNADYFLNKKHIINEFMGFDIYPN